MLNHAIFLPNELRRGFARLEAKEIIEIKESKLRLTPRGIEIRDNVRGGLFSIVDNTFKKLNSIKQETLSKTELRHFDFLSDKDIENEILKYKRRDGRK